MTKAKKINTKISLRRKGKKEQEEDEGDKTVIVNALNIFEFEYKEFFNIVMEEYSSIESPKEKE